MLPQLLSHSPDLKRLVDEGYNVEVRSNYLLLKDVPYVTPGKTVARGIIVSELTTSGDAAAKPGNHLVSFVGEIPCDNNGQELEIINEKGNVNLAPGLDACCKFSSKRPDRDYADYYEKMTTYANTLLGYAQVLEPNIDARTFPPAPTGDDTVFRYMDSATSRAQLSAISEKLKMDNIAIIGLGGTGSYVLDFVAKTPVGHIHLFDGDTFYTHNAFRAPGAASLDELKATPLKVEYFQRKYDPMHRNIIAHPTFITEANIDELKGLDFVFLTLEGGAAKKLVVGKLEEFGIPFIDTGMGVYEVGGSLGGIVRATASTNEQRQHVQQRISFADDDGNNDYERNIQIADLNALNAIMAVIKWKKLCGFYSDLEHEYSSSYTIDGNHLLNEDKLT